MNVTRTLLKYLLEHPGVAFKSTDLARATGCTLPNQIAATPACLANLRDAKAISQVGGGRGSTWMVGRTPHAMAAATAYLQKPDRGCGRRKGNPFNRGTPRDAVQHDTDETPREHAYPPVRPGGVAPFPPEPLRYTIDDDGDLQITGRNTGTTYLLIPKLDAVDLLEFARRSAPHLEAA